MVQAIITPRSPIAELDQRSNTIKLTREGFLFLDSLNRSITDIASVLIINTITDGITDQAPSSNAVFDALVLKANVSALSAYLTTAAAVLGYQPLDSQLTTLAALADAAGALTNDGAGNFSWVASSSGGLTLGTPVASTSGTAIDYTGLPSGTKIVVANYNGVSGSGTSQMILQIGDAGGIETSGYAGQILNPLGGASALSAGFTASQNPTAAGIFNGQTIMVLTDSTNGIWTATSTVSTSAGTVWVMGGSKTLSPGPLDRVRFTFTDGTSTFDLGSVNIAYGS